MTFPHPKQLLAEYGLEPKKSLGQNFLFDPNILQRIVAVADLQPDEQVLEIGPGLGALTWQLAPQVARLVAVELDDRFWPVLPNQLASFPHVTLVQGDILEQDMADLFPPPRPFKVVANVPYYVTGRILRYLVEGAVKPTVAVLTIQKEVAERLTAVAGEMSLLAVGVQFYGAVSLEMNLPAGAFYPRPTVASSVIKIDFRQRDPVTLTVADETRFFTLVRTGFSQKRKQLQKNLRALAPDVAWLRGVLDTAVIDGSRRAETLTLAEWVALYHAWYPEEIM